VQVRGTHGRIFFDVDEEDGDDPHLEHDGVHLIAVGEDHLVLAGLRRGLTLAEMGVQAVLQEDERAIDHGAAPAFGTWASA
jgi:hypothetical protein